MLRVIPLFIFISISLLPSQPSIYLLSLGMQLSLNTAAVAAAYAVAYALKVAVKNQ